MLVKISVLRFPEVIKDVFAKWLYVALEINI